MATTTLIDSIHITYTYTPQRTPVHCPLFKQKQTGVEVPASRVQGVTRKRKEDGKARVGTKRGQDSLHVSSHTWTLDLNINTLKA